MLVVILLLVPLSDLLLLLDSSLHHLLVELQELGGVVQKLFHAIQVVLCIFLHYRGLASDISHKVKVLHSDLVWNQILLLVIFVETHLVKPIKYVVMVKLVKTLCFFIYIICNYCIFNHRLLGFYYFILSFLVFLNKINNFSFLKNNSDYLKVGLSIDVKKIQHYVFFGDAVNNLSDVVPPLGFVDVAMRKLLSV